MWPNPQAFTEEALMENFIFCAVCDEGNNALTNLSSDL